MKTIPVTLITGFLGSGKTTLLNHLVRQPELADTLVIINEFGDISLDHLLVAHSNEDMVMELSSGCVCCTVRHDLVKTLKDIDWRFSRGGKRQFKRVIIETTGMADPAPILHTLITNPELARRYRLEATLVTIDVAAGQNTLDSHHESVKQAAMGDRLLLTKVDLVTPEELEALQERLLEINPAAEQIVVANGELSANEILDQVAFDSQGKLADVRRWINENAYQRVAERKVGGQGFLRARANKAGRSSAHDDGIRAFCFTVDKPVSPERFDSWLNALMSLLGQNMLRMKGILNIEGRPRPMVVHGVQHIFHPPIYLPEWPSDDHRSRLVCITRNISQRVIEGSFDKLVSLNNDPKWDAV